MTLLKNVLLYHINNYAIVGLTSLVWYQYSVLFFFFLVQHNGR